MSASLDSPLSLSHEPEMYELPLAHSIGNNSGDSRLWKGFKVVFIFIFDTTLRVGIFVVLGVAAQIFYPLLAPPLFATVIAAFATRTIIRLFDAYDFNILLNIKEGVYNFVRRYSKLQLITFVFSLAICFLVQIAGIITGSALGIVNGIVMDIEISKQLRENPQNAAGNPKPIRDTVVI